MFSQLKRLGADSLLYAFMNVGTKLIAFIMFPVYTYYLSDLTEFGKLDYIDRIMSMLTFVVIFGTDSALGYYYYDTKDEKTRRDYIRTVMSFRLIIVALLFAIFFVFGDYLSEILLDSPGQSFLFYIAFGTLLIDTMINLALTILRYEFKTKRVVITTIFKMLLIAILSTVFLSYVWTSIAGVLVGRLVSVVIVFILLLKFTIPYLRPVFDKEILKKIMVYATPLVPASIAFWVILNVNVIFLKEYSSFEEVAIYGTAIKFAMFITLLTSGIQLAWRPFSMSLKDKKDSPVLFARLYAAILVLGSLGVLLLATIMPWVIKILSDEYEQAYPYVAPLAIATFLNFYYQITSTGTLFSKQTKHISIAFAISAVLSIALCFIFIPIFDIWGAVISYVVSYCLALYLVFSKSQKFYYIPFSGVKMAFTILTLIVSTIAIVYVQVMDLNMILVAVAWLVFIGTLCLLRFDKDILNKRRI